MQDYPRNSNRKPMIGCRVEAPILEAFQAEAERRGMAVSELIRAAIGRELEIAAAERERSHNGLDPALVARAASGSLEAQRAIVQLMLSWASLPTLPTDQVFAVGEFSARMAAAHGYPEDAFILATFLFHRAERYARTSVDIEMLEAEAIALLNDAADRGHGPSIEGLAVIASMGVAPRVFDLAERFDVVSDKTAVDVTPDTFAHAHLNNGEPE